MEHSRIAEINVFYRPNLFSRVKVTSSSSAYVIILEDWDLDTISLFEEFKVLLLNRANYTLGIYTLSKGGMSGTVVDVKLLMAVALKSAACSMILVHNHPSGNLQPSEADKTITRKIVEGGKLLDLQILDHLIVTGEGYYSFADEGLL